MEHARVVGIFVAPEEGAPVTGLEQARAVPGKGLEGDRYFKMPDARREPKDEITLIAEEGLEEAGSSHGLELEPGEHRRNVVTRGTDLDSLIGKKLRVGDVVVRALEPNPPCRYLQETTGKPVLKALIRAGGIRGQILTEGTIRVGDAITGDA